MPRVVFTTSQCSQFTSGLAEIDVEAKDVRAMLAELDARFPGLAEFIEKRQTMVIDGQRFQGWTAPLKDSSEILLIPRIAGG